MEIEKVIGKEMIWEWAAEKEIKEILENSFKKEYGSGAIEACYYDYKIKTMLEVVLCSEIFCLDRYNGEQLSLNSGICYIKEDFDSWKQKNTPFLKVIAKLFAIQAQTIDKTTAELSSTIRELDDEQRYRSFKTYNYERKIRQLEKYERAIKRLGSPNDIVKLGAKMKNYEKLRSDNGILKGEVRMLRDERRSLKAKISQLEKNIKTINS